MTNSYDWMEHADSDSVRSWLEARRKESEAYLSQLPDRESIGSALTELTDLEEFSVPVWRGDKEYFARQEGRSNKFSLWVRDHREPSASELEIFHSGQVGAGTVLIPKWYISSSARWIVVEKASTGSEQVEFVLVEVATLRCEHIAIDGYRSGSLVWYGDKGFFFVRRASIREPQEIGYWTIAGAGWIPVKVTEFDGTERRLSIAISRDASWICTSAYFASGRVSLHIGRADWASTGELRGYWLARDCRRVLASFGLAAKFYHCTDEDIRNQVMQVNDLGSGSRYVVPFRVPQGEELLGFTPFASQQASDAFILKLSTGTSSYLRCSLDGELILPGAGAGLVSVGAVTSDPQRPDSIWFSQTSYASPPGVFRANLANHMSTPHRVTAVQDGPAMTQRSERIRSFDGCEIPLTLLGPPGFMERPAPTILFVYGGFRMSLRPRFMASPRLWVSAGGTYVIAHVRGGGEFGAKWHTAAIGERKGTSILDYLAAAQWLLGHGLCEAQQLVGEGASNGGLVVSSAIVQRPEIMVAALITAPVCDLLRFHLFGAGRNWLEEYGNPDNPEEYAHLARLSPLHNIRAGVDYPAVLISAWSGDDRVDSMHARKFCAALADASTGYKPILFRDSVAAGHGANTRMDRITLAADRLAFAARWAGLDIGQHQLEAKSK